MLYTEIRLRYFHPTYNLAFNSPREVWLLSDQPVRIQATVYRGTLVYRLPSTWRRVSYRQLKKAW